MDFETRRACGDGKALVAELSDDVEGLARRLFERESELIRCDGTLDLGADMRCRLEEAVRRHQSVERLVRPLEVVVADEVLEPALRVDDVGEDGAAQKLVPQRLPEALDLAQRLRVLRAAADVLHTHPCELLLEFGLAAPHGVLPAVVGQHLRRLAVRRHRALEGLHHQGRLLVVRERMSDDKAAVVVHEHADVKSLGAPQPEGEDVRLPQLVRRRSFEAPRRVLALCHRRWRLDESLPVQDPPDLLFTHPERFEASEYVANAATPPILVFTLERDYLLALDRVWWLRRSVVRAPARFQAGRSPLAEQPHPLRDRGLRHPEDLRDVVLLRAS